MKKVLRYLSFIGFIVILFGVGTITVSLLWTGSTKAGSRESFMSAFGGAAFAYLFVKIGEFFTLLYKRHKLDNDTLVSTEYLMNQHLTELADISSSASSLVDSLRSTEIPIVISFNPLKTIDTGNIRLYDLLNIDLINELFAYFSKLRRINSDLETLQIVATEMRQIAMELSKRRLSDPVTISTLKHYQVNARNLSDTIDNIRQHIDDLRSDTYEFIAKIRIEYDQKSVWLQLPIPWAATKHYNQHYMQKHLSKLTQEIKRESNSADYKIDNSKDINK